MYQRPTNVPLEVLPLVRKFYGSIELRCVQSVVSKIEIKVTAHFPRAGSRDDLDTSEAGTTVLSSKWIVIDANFFNLILRWDTSAEEPINDELHAAGCSRSRPGKLGQVIRQFVFIFGQALNVVFVEYKCRL